MILTKITASPEQAETQWPKLTEWQRMLVHQAKALEKKLHVTILSYDGFNDLHDMEVFQ